MGGGDDGGRAQVAFDEYVHLVVGGEGAGDGSPAYFDGLRVGPGIKGSGNAESTDRSVGCALGRGLDFVLAASGQTQSKDGDEIENLFHDTCFKGLPRDGFILVYTCHEDSSLGLDFDDLRYRRLV